MQRDELVHMLNQVAAYYAAYPEAEAVEGVCSHLQRFWQPTMLQQLGALRTDPRLSQLAHAAILRLAPPQP